MRRFLALLALALGSLAVVLSGPSRARAALAMPEAVASYRIGVRYDPSTHELTGREAVTWNNTSREPVRDLQLHLYWTGLDWLGCSPGSPWAASICCLPGGRRPAWRGRDPVREFGRGARSAVLTSDP